jgi:hypothetical protein
MFRLPRLKPVAIGKFDPFSGVEKFRPAGVLIIEQEVAEPLNNPRETGKKMAIDQIDHNPGAD